MIRNTWEAMLDLVQSVLGVGHSMIDIVHAGIDDVRNMGDHVGAWVGGKSADDEDDEDWEVSEVSEEDIAELVNNVRKDEKRKK